jgi:hypothetical protein
MTDDFPELRRLLDTAPVPALPPVDLARLYRDAFDRQARSTRRWKRVAGGVAALAASVLAVAVLQGWWAAKPEPVASAPDPRVAELLADQQRQIAALRATNEKIGAVQELLLTLAADVDQRDKDQQKKMTMLATRLGEFETLTARQFQESEKTSTALYNVVFNNKPKGVNP